MKRIVFVMLCMILLLSACGNNDSKDKSNDTKSDNASTKTFKQDDGTKVKIPKNPKELLFYILHILVL